MSNLKQKLIRLGSEHPELRDHISPVLDALSQSRQDLRKTALLRFKEDKGRMALSIGGPMNRDYRIGDPIPSDAEWVVRDNVAGKAYHPVAGSYRELREIVDRAIEGISISDRDWKRIEATLEAGNTVKISIQLPRVELYT